MAENVGGIYATATIDASGMAQGSKAVETAIMDVAGRLYDVRGKFIAAADASKYMVVQAGSVQAVAAQQAASISRQATSLNQVSIASAQATGKMSDFGSKMMVVGMFADDMQYGLRAVVNQIPQVAMAFGAGAGLAGALSIVAVAANQVVNRWDRMISVFTTKGAETASQEMERLANATGRTADEQKRLNDLKRDEAIIEQQRTRRTEAEQENTQRVGKAIQESPYDVLNREVQAALLMGKNDDIEREVGRRVGVELGPDLGKWSPRRAKARASRTEEIREEVQEGMRARAKEEAEQLLKGAENGSGRDEATLLEMARRNRNMPALQRFARLARPSMAIEASMQLEEGALRSQNEAEQKRVEQMRLEARGSRQRRLIEQGMEVNAWNKWVGDQDPDDWELRDETPEEKKKREAKLLQGMQRNVRKSLNDNEEERRDADKREDLNARLFNLLNQPKEGKSLSIEAYNDSIKSTNGADQLRQLQEINKTLREIKQLDEKQRGVVAIRR